jgi:hypothetical protein
MVADRQRDRGTERQMNKQIYIQTELKTYRHYTDKQTDIQTVKRYRKTGRQANRQMYRKTNVQT